MPLLLVDAARLQAEGDVLLDGKPGVEVRLLEYEAAVVRGPLDGLAAVLDGTALRFVQAGDKAQKRRLAAAGGPDERDDLAVFRLEVEVMKGGELALVGVVEHAQHVFRDEALVGLANSGRFLGVYHWTTSFDQLMV